VSDSTISKDTIVIERTFDAPVELIWQMWTQPEHFAKWYGPERVNVTVAEMDVRIGGKHLFCMEIPTPDGTMKFWMTGEYTEIVPNERLVYTDSIADENGNLVAPSTLGWDDDFPASTQVTVQLESLGERTRMVLTHAGVSDDTEGANEGWEQSFSKMATYVASVANRS
jgi:uncharacterized protein YndB with AHSA1/START domain